jgi:hypothetical protein
MATPVPSSGSVSVNDLKAAFPNINSNSLGDYKGVKWYKSDNSRGYFPSGANAYVSMNDFHDTRYNSPVVPGNLSVTGTRTWTIPLFNKLNIQLRGGDGGQGGNNGNWVKNGSVVSISAGSPGSAGGSSSFSNYFSASGGSGGGVPSGSGGSGATTNNQWDADANSSLLSHQGETVTITIGGVGAGGAGGHNYGWYADYVCIPFNGCYWTDPYWHDTGSNGDGSAGTTAGNAYISWT